MNAPPLLVSFSSLADYLSALDPSLREEYETEITNLYNQGLPPVVSTRCLAVLFGYSTKFVNAMINRNSKYYRHFSVRKGKKKRVINAPKVALKVIQKWFGYHLANALTFEDLVFGFIEGRSAIEAAGIHKNSKWVFSIDIANFFPTTPQVVVKNEIQTLGYSEKGSSIITTLCCYKENLAQGAPSSPVLSNLTMKNIDIQLFKIATEHGVRVTRYADDIVFSGKEEFPEALRNEAKQIFEDSCWELSNEKEYYASLPQRLKVHGLLVHNERPRLTKGYRNKIRAFRHMLESNKVHEKDRERLAGHINYANSVDKYEK
jgi:RNA-directed DNA polymerase